MDETVIIPTSLPLQEHRSEERNGARNGAGAPMTSPLRTEESFDAYCRQVQTRIAEHAQHRRHFLQNAYERLTQLLHTARAVEDNALYNELWQLRVATRELLESLRQVQGSAFPNAGQDNFTHPMPLSSTEIRGRSAVSNGSANKPWAITKESDARPPLFSSGSTSREAVVSAGGYSPRRAVRALEDIAADTKRLREQIIEWKAQYPLLQENGELHIPNCLRHRALICRLRKLEEEAGETEVAEVADAIDDLVAFLDAAGDEEYTVALDDELNPPPTAFQWGEMGDRYEEMARAQEAFDWWFRHQERLTVSHIQPVAEAVAAVQQRFNRLLFRTGTRDPYQQRLFDNLRQWARESQCYLHSLRPKVPIAELIERASTLEDALQRAHEALQRSENDLVSADSQKEIHP